MEKKPFLSIKEDDEALVTAILRKDICKRHTYFDAETPDEDTKCVQCHNILTIKDRTLFVKKAGSEEMLPLCNRTCIDEHEVSELEIYSCNETKGLPPVNAKLPKISEAALEYLYSKRLIARRQDIVDHYTQPDLYPQNSCIITNEP